MIQLAMYVGKGNWMDKLIRWKTGSVYSHCELVIDGISYSSSAQDEGVRAKTINFSNGNWELLDITDIVDKKMALSIFSDFDGYCYGYLDLLFHHFFDFQLDGHGIICSDLCGKMIGVPNPEQLSPGELYSLCKWKISK